MITFLALLATAAVSWQSPPQGVLYDVRYDAGRAYEGTARISVASGGAVSGSLAIETPLRMSGDIRGTIAGGRVTFDHPYTIGDCTGRMQGSGAVSRNGASIEGTVEIGGACVPQPLKGTFRFTRRAEGAQAAPPQPGISWEPYTLRTDAGPIEADLGRLLVPERRSNPASRRITIAFARLRSTSPSPGAPIVYLDGGPGGSGVSTAQVPAFGALFRR